MKYIISFRRQMLGDIIIMYILFTMRYLNGDILLPVVMESPLDFHKSIICIPGPHGGPCRRPISTSSMLMQFTMMQMVVWTFSIASLAISMESIFVFQP